MCQGHGSGLPAPLVGLIFLPCLLARARGCALATAATARSLGEQPGCCLWGPASSGGPKGISRDRYLVVGWQRWPVCFPVCRWSLQPGAGSPASACRPGACGGLTHAIFSVRRLSEQRVAFLLVSSTVLGANTQPPCTCCAQKLGMSSALIQC